MSEHRIEITYGVRQRDRKVVINGHDITSMVLRDGLEVEFTETGPVVSLVLRPKRLDVDGLYLSLFGVNPHGTDDETNAQRLDVTLEGGSEVKLWFGDAGDEDTDG